MIPGVIGIICKCLGGSVGICYFGAVADAVICISCDGISASFYIVQRTIEVILVVDDKRPISNLGLLPEVVICIGYGAMASRFWRCVTASGLSGYVII